MLASNWKRSHGMFLESHFYQGRHCVLWEAWEAQNHVFTLLGLLFFTVFIVVSLSYGRLTSIIPMSTKRSLWRKYLKCIILITVVQEKSHNVSDISYFKWKHQFPWNKSLCRKDVSHGVLIERKSTSKRNFRGSEVNILSIPLIQL